MKLYPQADTKADEGDFFLTIKDQKRNVFSIVGPLSDDLPWALEINAANSVEGSDRWKITGSRDGPRLGAGALRESQIAMPTGTFVDNALSATAQPVAVSKTPPFWS